VKRRWIAPALALALLAGSALAFAYTERIKVEPSPIAGTLVTKVFSPVCNCPTDTALISFRLRRPSRVTVDVIDPAGEVVRTLGRDDRRGVGRVFYRWDGRDADGAVVSEASTYRPRVRLAEHGRTIVLPNAIRIDVTPPVIHLVSVQPRTFSPNGDGRNDRITARYEMSERAEPALYADGERRVVGLFKRRVGKLDWNGDGVVPPSQGTIEISMLATDLAGNTGAPSRSVPVVVRFVKLGRDAIVVAPKQRFAVGVFTDQAAYRWRFAGKTGVSSARSLRLTAPASPGRFTLFVTTPDDHADSAVVTVRPAP
jgi:hypothetical protein